MTTLRTLSLLSLGLLLASSPAEARPPRGRPAPRRASHPHVVIAINPWAIDYRPDARPGWDWVPGYYNARRVWVPGYWRPVAVRVGWAWIPGYWVGPDYVEGSWREAERPGWVWVEGEYDDGGHWIEGHWEAVPPPPPAPPPPLVPAQGVAPTEPPPPPPEEGDVHHDYE